MASASKVHFHEIPPRHANWHKQGKRFGFVGHSASKNIEKLYLGKGFPQVLRIQRKPNSIRQLLESVGSACVLFAGPRSDMECPCQLLQTAEEVYLRRPCSRCHSR